MPQVPTYDGPQVQTRGLSFAEASPDAFGANQGKQLNALGTGVSTVGTALDYINERETTRQVMDAEEKAKKAYLDWSTEAMKEGQGAGAAGITQRAKDWWGKTTEELAKGMNNPMAQRMFQSAISRQAMASAGEFARFENQQLEIDLAQKTDANVASSQKLAAQIPTPENIALQEQSMRAALAAYGAKRWSPEVLKDKTDKAIAGMNLGVFNNLFVRDPIGAKAYFEKNRDKFDPTQYDEIEGRLKTGVADAEGGAAARTVVAQFTQGLNLTDAYPAQKIEAELDKLYADKPEVLKAARAESDRKMALWNKQQSESTAAAVSTVMDALNAPGASLADVKRLPQWNQMTGEQRATLEQRWTDRQEMLADREDRRADRAERRADRLERKQLLDMAPEALRLSQPENLAKMTRADIINKMPVLGAKLTASLLKEWEGYQKDTVKLADAKYDNDAFNTLMFEAGFDPKPRTNDKEGSEFVVSMKDRVKARLAAAQTAQRRELTDDEKRDLMKQVIHAKVLMPAFISGYNEESEYKVDPTQAALKGSVRVNYQDANGIPRTGVVKLTDIPANEATLIASSLKKRGLGTTQAEVAQAWYDWRNSNKK